LLVSIGRSCSSIDSTDGTLDILRKLERFR
jgi:hypothetical protein